MQLFSPRSLIFTLLSAWFLGGLSPYAHGQASLVADIVPGIGGSSLAYLTNVNGTLYFRATDVTNGTELWKSDGTTAGTVRVKDIYPGSVGSSPTYLINVNGTLYFRASDGTTGQELWKSDGTAAGTVLVKDINPGSGSSSPNYLTNVNGTLYFAANDGTNGNELWKSDGTAVGTVLVKDINPGSGNSSPYYLINVNGTLYFNANDGTTGQELWKSDGTAAGTVRVKDISPGIGGSSLAYLTNVNGTLYFSATDGTNGIELWKSDGTAAGTVLVKDINPSGSSSPQYLTDVNGTLYFAANDGTNGFELWKSDGTAAGTVLVKDINPSGSSSLNGFTDMNGTLYFSAHDGTNGNELWKSDGTAAGTVQVQDINPGSGHSYPYYLTNVNGTLYFSANDGTNGQELWKSDGTAAGTVLVQDINPGSGHSYPAYLTDVNGTLYFRADDGTNGTELWKAGAPAATDLEFVVGTGTAGPSNTITVPVSVNNFTGIGTYQGTITFDPAVLSVASVNALNLPATSSFGLPGQGSVPNDALTFVWYESTLTPATVADGTTVIEVTFTVSPGATTGFTDIEIDGSVTPLGYATDLTATSLSTPLVTQGGLQIDADAPTTQTASISSNNANSASLATVGDVITLVFTTSEAPAVTPVVTIVEGGAGVVTVSGSGTSWTATKTVATGGDGLVTFSIEIEDIYGNSSTLSATTDASSVTVDTEDPTITCPATINQNNDPGNCTAVVTFTTPTGNDNLAGYSVTQTGGPASGAAFPVGTTSVTFTVTDAAGNTTDCSFDVIITDNEAPVVLTQPVTVELDVNGQASIVPADVDNVSYDQCGIATRTLDIDQFDCTDVGTPVTVTLTVTDVNGNVASNTAVVTVVANPVIGLSGGAYYALATVSTPIPGVVWDINGDDGPLSTTGSTFSFLATPCGTTNDIGANKIDDAATNNGVDVNDAVDIVKHILLIQPFASPYQRIAADVDATTSINVLDVIQVLRKIANIKQYFTNPVTQVEDAIWTFIPSDYVFANPSNPFPFETRRTYISPSPSTGQDFNGVKLGDVNNSWNPAVLRHTAPADSFYFAMDDAGVLPGERMTIPVRVRDFQDIAGYQFTMSWDASVLAYRGVTPRALDGVYGSAEAGKGKITSAWVDMAGQGVTLSDGTVVFELEFEVVGAWGSETSFEMTSEITMTKGVKNDDTDLGIGMVSGKIEVGGSATGIDPYELKGYSLGQNVPNPFTAETTLNFSLGQAEEVQIEIYNVTGQLVKSFSGKYPAGQHELIWNGSSDSGHEVSQGVYMVNLQAGGYVSAIRVMKVK
ncbi:MAG: cohesin domain-containing protein [Bacteroidia bacterium]